MENFNKSTLNKIAFSFNSTVVAAALSGCVTILEPKTPEMPHIPEIDMHAIAKHNEIRLLAKWIENTDDCSKNLIDFMKCSTLLKIMADRNPAIQNAARETLAESNINPERLEKIKKETLDYSIKNTIAALSENGKPNIPAHHNLLALYDGKREEFEGLEEFVQENIDRELAGRGLEIGNIRATYDRETQKLGRKSPLTCGRTGPDTFECRVP